MSKKQSNPGPPNVLDKPTPPPPPPPKRSIREDVWRRPKGAGPLPNRNKTGMRSLWCIIGFHKLRNTEPKLAFWGRYKCIRGKCNYATLGVSEMFPGMPASPKPKSMRKKNKCTCGYVEQMEKTRCPVLQCYVRLNGWCPSWHNGYCGFHGKEM